MLCFLLSIQGAGPIRTISHLQQWLGCGPVHCQVQNGGLATTCMWAYVFRMFWIQFYTMYTRGVYCKMRGDSKLTGAFLSDLLQNCAMLAAMLAFSYMPYNEELLALVLGHERTARGSFSVLIAGVLQLYGDQVGLDIAPFAPQVVNRCGDPEPLQHPRRRVHFEKSATASCIPCTAQVQKDDCSSRCRRPRCLPSKSMSFKDTCSGGLSKSTSFKRGVQILRAASFHQ